MSLENLSTRIRWKIDFRTWARSTKITFDRLPVNGPPSRESYDSGEKEKRNGERWIHAATSNQRKSLG